MLWKFTDFSFGYSFEKVIANLNWQVNIGESWLVWGANGSGKSTLLRLIKSPPFHHQGTIFRSAGLDSQIQIISHELQRELLAQEAQEMVLLEIDDKLRGRQVLDLLNSSLDSKWQPILDVLNLESIYSKYIMELSNGETRRLLIAMALSQNPKVLLLDEIFDGLDPQSRIYLQNALEQLPQLGISIILVSHRIEEALSCTNRIIHLENGSVRYQGPIDHFEPSNPCDTFTQPLKIPQGLLTREINNQIRVQLNDVTIDHEGQKILHNFNWTLAPHEHWLIEGANGSGKTTFMRLIAGDHPQAYQNEIYLFGRRRGTGESIWDIKSKIGWFSPHFQALYPAHWTAIEVIISGFYDSQGIYKCPTLRQSHQAQLWLDLLDLGQFAKRSLTQLSYGQQRLILIARAMVKEPEILILDEACEGLDSHYRGLVINFCDQIASLGWTQILFSSHYASEYPKCLNRKIEFDHHQHAIQSILPTL